MTWTRVSDDYTERMLDVSDAAFRLDIQASVWCNRLLTDGKILRRRLPLIWPGRDDLDLLAEELISIGRWTSDEEAFYVDWSDQETAEAVKVRREGTRERQREYMARRDRHNAGDHSTCTKNCPHRKRFDAVRDAVSDNGTEDVSDSLPYPPSPSGERERETRGLVCPQGHPALEDSPAYCWLGHQITSEEAA